MANVPREALVFPDADLKPRVQAALTAGREGKPAWLGNLQKAYADRFRRVGDSFRSDDEGLKLLYAQGSASRAELQYLLERDGILDDKAVPPDSPWYYFQVATTPDVLVSNPDEKVEATITIPRLCLSEELREMTVPGRRIKAAMKGQEALDIGEVDIGFHTDAPMTVRFSGPARTVHRRATKMLELLLRERMISDDQQDHVFDTVLEQTDIRVKGRRKERFSPQRLSAEAAGNEEVILKCVAQMRQRCPSAGIRVRIENSGVVEVSYLLGVMGKPEVERAARETGLLSETEVLKQQRQCLEINPSMLGAASETLRIPSQLTALNTRANEAFSRSHVEISLGSMGELRASFLAGALDPQALLEWLAARRSRSPFLQPDAAFSEGPTEVELTSALQIGETEAVFLRIPTLSTPQEIQARKSFTGIEQRLQRVLSAARLERLPHEFRVTLPLGGVANLCESVKAALLVLQQERFFTEAKGRELRRAVPERLFATSNLGAAQIDLESLQQPGALNRLQGGLNSNFPGRDIKLELGVGQLSIQYRNGTVTGADLVAWLRGHNPELFPAEYLDGAPSQIAMEVESDGGEGLEITDGDHVEAVEGAINGSGANSSLAAALPRREGGRVSANAALGGGETLEQFLKQPLDGSEARRQFERLFAGL